MNVNELLVVQKGEVLMLMKIPEEVVGRIQVAAGFCRQSAAAWVLGAIEWGLDETETAMGELGAFLDGQEEKCAQGLPFTDDGNLLSERKEEE